MNSRRVSCFISLLLLTSLWIFSDFPAALLLLGVIFLFLLFDLIHLAIIKDRITCRMELETPLQKGQNSKGILRIENGALLPASRIDFLVHMENLLTGEHSDIRMTAGIPVRGIHQVQWQVPDEYCGKICMLLEEVCLYDLLGLVCIHRKPDIKKEVVVLPWIFPMEIELTESQMADMESLRYSQTKRGEDTGEIFGIREYRPGDSLKNIHWKLTGKMDDLYVKELGMPIQHSILLLFETAQETDQKQKPVIRDAMMETLLSVSQSLAEAGHSHWIGWYDIACRKFSCCEVRSVDELAALMGGILGIRSVADTEPAIRCYLKEYQENPFAHVVYITDGEAEEEFQLLQQMCTAVMLKCTSEGEKYSGTGREIVFTPEQKHSGDKSRSF